MPSSPEFKQVLVEPPEGTGPGKPSDWCEYGDRCVDLELELNRVWEFLRKVKWLTYREDCANAFHFGSTS